MSTIFNRITTMKHVEEHSFYAGSAIFDLLMPGDVPLSSEGDIATVISIAAAKIAALLCKARVLQEKDVPLYLRRHFTYEMQLEHSRQDDAMAELQEDMATAKMLLRDFRSAARKQDYVVYYRVS